MRKWRVLFSFIFVFSSGVHAQTQEEWYDILDLYVNFIEEHQVDSIEYYRPILLSSAHSTDDSVEIAIADVPYHSEQGDKEKCDSVIAWMRGVASRTNNEAYRNEALMMTSYAGSQYGDFIGSNVAAFTALPYYESQQDTYNISTLRNTIAINYTMAGEHKKALEYYALLYAEAVAINDSMEIATYEMNAGYAHEKLGDQTTAMKKYMVSYEIHKKLNIQRLIGLSAVLVGPLYTRMDLPDLAKPYLDEAYDLLSAANDYYGLSYAHGGLSEYYYNKKDYAKAKYHADEGMLMAKNCKFTENIIWALNNTHLAQAARGNHKEAYQAYHRYISLRDSVFNNKNKDRIAGMDIRHEFDQKFAADSLSKANELALNNLKHEERVTRYQMVGVVGVLAGLFLVGMLIVLVKSIKTRKQKNAELRANNATITEQKHQMNQQKVLVEEKNKEILDSINYAKRIQEAILPNRKLVKTYLDESFILYKPKDIVSGDFYFFSVGDNAAPNTYFFAAADCTGHGVPGAMVSVLCANALSRCVNEFKLESPAAILDRVNDIIEEQFKNSENDIQDGMDIALCRLDLDNNRVEFAGANNPLWIIRNHEMTSIPANKQPIGLYDDKSAFVNHSYDLQKGDMLYVFSDGYVDQFGGPKGKKLKRKALQTLLLEISDRPLDQQHRILDSHFEQWKGDLEQIDDVCVIGVRV